MLKKMLEEKLKKVIPKKTEMVEEASEMYPTLFLSSDALPEIEDFEVGKDYELVLKVEQKSKNMRKEGKNNVCSAEFSIKKAGVLESKEDNKSIKEKYVR